MSSAIKLLAGLGIVTVPAAGLLLFHQIVERKVRENFAQLSAGNYEFVLSQMALRFDHFFSGTHPLGGKRHSVDAMRRWFERLYTINQNLRFEVLNVAVSGTPWNTNVVVEWIDRATLANGDPYINQGVHFVRMRWGKVISLHAYLDTQVFAEACERMAQAGVAEAAAALITG
jgi:ketosteroid isomerase-like protein